MLYKESVRRTAKMVVRLFLAIVKHRLGAVRALDKMSLGFYQRIIKEAEKIQELNIYIYIFISI